MKKGRFAKTLEIKNKRAFYDYEWIEKYTAGIVLYGTEIKSIREGQASLTHGYCYFHQGEAYLKGVSIRAYEQGTQYNHKPDRDRKLLLKKKELQKLIAKIEEKGLVVVPVRLFINERGWVKIELILGRGKKLYDKRTAIKEREIKRSIRQMDIH